MSLAGIRYHENAFGELARCCEIFLWYKYLQFQLTVLVSLNVWCVRRPVPAFSVCQASRRMAGNAKVTLQCRSMDAIVYQIIDNTTLRPRWNRRYFWDDIFKCIFLNENILISITTSLKFIPKGPINIIQALVQIMAWRRPGDKPLSEPMMIILLTLVCVTRPQWVNK